jgi:hypothetical protein
MIDPARYGAVVEKNSGKQEARHPGNQRVEAGGQPPRQRRYAEYGGHHENEELEVSAEQHLVE